MSRAGELRSRPTVAAAAVAAVAGRARQTLGSGGSPTGAGKAHAQLLRKDGSFNWLRSAKDDQSRTVRRAVARETLDAVDHGWYLHDSKPVKLQSFDVAEANTRIISQSDESWPILPEEPPFWSTTTVRAGEDESVFDVSVRLARQGRRVVAICASSAHHVGGGFTTGGRHALEEAMCVQSTLYRCLWHAWRQAGVLEGYPYIPPTGAVLSPMVEVFRRGTDSGYTTLPEPVQLAGVVAVAMPNLNCNVSDAPVEALASPEQYREAVVTRWRAALHGACALGAVDLVCPDAGCGVYRNNPQVTGEVLGRVLRAECWGQFERLWLVGTDEFCRAVESSIAMASDEQSLPGSKLRSASAPHLSSLQDDGLITDCTACSSALAQPMDSHASCSTLPLKPSPSCPSSSALQATPADSHASSSTLPVKPTESDPSSGALPMKPTSSSRAKGKAALEGSASASKALPPPQLKASLLSAMDGSPTSAKQHVLKGRSNRSSSSMPVRRNWNRKPSMASSSAGSTRAPTSIEDSEDTPLLSQRDWGSRQGTMDEDVMGDIAHRHLSPEESSALLVQYLREIGASRSAQTSREAAPHVDEAEEVCEVQPSRNINPGVMLHPDSVLLRGSWPAFQAGIPVSSEEVRIQVQDEARLRSEMDRLSKNSQLVTVSM